MSETPAGTEGDDHLVTFHKSLPGSLQGLVRIGKEIFNGLARERSVVTERAPAHVAGPDLYAVILGEWRTGQQSFDAVKNGHGIVQCAERIDAYIESEFFELSADAVGKAAS